MANMKISELTSTTNVNETDVFPIVQENTTKKITSKNLINGMIQTKVDTATTDNGGTFSSYISKDYDIVSVVAFRTDDGGQTRAEVYSKASMNNHKIKVFDLDGNVLSNTAITYRIRYIVN